ncbi:MAG TPA: hypothetical protein VKS98_03835 [Chthoniobacterales bacterium]|nr:hypothetical protein [Chthoniobacterales bacterium]
MKNDVADRARDARADSREYHHGATVCVIKPFSARELASIINSVCLHVHRFKAENPVEAISVSTSKAALREPPE